MANVDDHHNQKLSFMLFSTTTGVLLRTLRHDGWEDGQVNTGSLMFDSSNYAVASLELYGHWYITKVKVESTASGDINQIWTLYTKHGLFEVDGGNGHSII